MKSPKIYTQGFLLNKVKIRRGFVYTVFTDKLGKIQFFEKNINLNFFIIYSFVFLEKNRSFFLKSVDIDSEFSDIARSWKDTMVLHFIFQFKNELFSPFEKNENVFVNFYKLLIYFRKENCFKNKLQFIIKYLFFLLCAAGYKVGEKELSDFLSKREFIIIKKILNKDEVEIGEKELITQILYMGDLFESICDYKFKSFGILAELLKELS